MSERVSAFGRIRELGKFLEIQNLALNLPFGLAFLLVAAGGLPSARTTALVVVAFVAARNAGHSFNRWADRDFDARNPRTQGRALVTGRTSPAFALTFAGANGAVLVAAAYLLNLLSFLLAPLALLAIFGYSYTKRSTSLTTVALGVVEAITPGAVFIAVTGTLPLAATIAVVALLLWGTAFETIHSLGDLESDRALGLHSLPDRLGVVGSARLTVALHTAALVLMALFGLVTGLHWEYFGAIGAMAIMVGLTDRGFLRAPTQPAKPFRRHFVLSGLFLLGVIAALFVP